MHTELRHHFQNVQRGDLARLIPMTAESSREARAVSVLLSALVAVDEFGRQMLGSLRAPAGKKARIQGFTEVEFKHNGNGAARRPDGLIICRQGRSRTWTALIEAKIGNNELQTEQVEAYLDLAREQGIDAVITISNQFVARPEQAPVRINGQKLRKVQLYHWSWLSIVSQAVILAENKAISDPDQAYLLKEVLRFYDHPQSGISEFSSMGASWRELGQAVRTGRALSKHDPIVAEATEIWHQLSRFLALKLSMRLGHAVQLYLRPAERRHPERRFERLRQELLDETKLSDEFAIPDAAAHLKLCADLRSRTLCASMTLDAPQDKHLASACVTWLRNHLKDCGEPEVIVTAVYPYRTSVLDARLGEVREDVRCLVTDRRNYLPRRFVVKLHSDSVKRFLGPRTFVEEALSLVDRFYAEVGQHLRVWQPPAPKPRPEFSTAQHAEAAPGAGDRKTAQTTAATQTDRDSRADGAARLRTSPDLSAMIPANAGKPPS